MEKFFTPKSVALVGASSTPGKIGNSVLDALRETRLTRVKFTQ